MWSTECSSLKGEYLNYLPTGCGLVWLFLSGSTSTLTTHCSANTEHIGKSPWLDKFSILLPTVALDSQREFQSNS